MFKGKKRIFIVTFLVACLIGCGKKNYREDIADDFDMIQSDTADSDSFVSFSDEFEMTVDGKTAKIRFDLSDIDSRVNKLIPAKIKTMQESDVLDVADSIFDSDSYDVADMNKKGTEIYGDQCVEIAQIQGEIDGSPYQFIYSNVVEGLGQGTRHITLFRLQEGVASYQKIHDTDEENVCDLRELTNQAKEWVQRFGYGDYELVYTADVKVCDLSGDVADEVDGYHFTFSRVIGDTVCGYYENNSFYEQGETFATAIERVELCITSQGLMYADFGTDYELQTATDCTELVPLGSVVETAKTYMQEQFDAMRLLYMPTENDDLSFVLDVELAYVPINRDGDIAYTPAYLFAFHDEMTENRWIEFAISAVDGELVGMDDMN